MSVGAATVGDPVSRKTTSWVCWCRLLITALVRQKGWWISEFKGSLVYRASSRTARATQRNPVLKKQNKTKQNKTKQNKTKQNKTNKQKTKDWGNLGREEVLDT